MGAELRGNRVTCPRPQPTSAIVPAVMISTNVSNSARSGGLPASSSPSSASYALATGNQPAPGGIPPTLPKRAGVAAWGCTVALWLRPRGCRPGPGRRALRRPPPAGREGPAGGGRATSYPPSTPCPLGVRAAGIVAQPGPRGARLPPSSTAFSEVSACSTTVSRCSRDIVHAGPVPDGVAGERGRCQPPGLAAGRMQSHTVIG